ncbi:MAG: beta-lactamase family protein [Acidobacteria bacterium]|nr:beta-lactamase family protein [Acidobacteriota bacterium]
MPSRLPFRTLAVAIAFAPTAALAQAPTPSRATIVARLDSIAESGVKAGRVVGLTVAVLQGDDTLLLKGYGKADVELNVPTPANAVYEIGSVTKQFTAAAILQLRDAGKLDLDADMSRYLPDFPMQGRKISVRRLLDHTSGIKGITELSEFPDLSRRALPRDSAIALIARQRFEFEPGEAQVYNNSAYILLGLIIEKQSGMSYEDYIEKNIFAKLGMTRSRYCNNTEVVEGRAHGHTYAGRELRLADYADLRWPYAAGSLCSTAGDMVTWLQALHGGKVLSAKSYTEMTTPARLADGTPTRYGMGISLANDPRGVRLISHGGAIEGFLSHASWYPDQRVTVVVLMNSTGPISPAGLASELAAQIIPPVSRPVRPFAGNASALVGTYTGPGRGRPMTVVITKGSDGGILVSPGGVPARPAAWVERLTFQSGPMEISFDTRQPGAPVLHVDGGTSHYVLKRQ